MRPERIWGEDRVCPLVRDIFVLYQDGALGEESKAYVRKHLVACADCGRYYKMMKKSRAALPEKETAKKSGKTSLLGADRYAELAKRLRRERFRGAMLQGALTAGVTVLAMTAVLSLRKRREQR